MLSSSSVDSSLLQDNVAFVLCLDTVGNGDTLHLHVSKPPKEGTPQFSLLKELESVRRAAQSALTGAESGAVVVMPPPMYAGKSGSSHKDVLAVLGHS